MLRSFGPFFLARCEDFIVAKRALNASLFSNSFTRFVRYGIISPRSTPHSSSPLSVSWTARRTSSTQLCRASSFSAVPSDHPPRCRTETCFPDHVRKGAPFGCACLRSRRLLLRAPEHARARVCCDLTALVSLLASAFVHHVSHPAREAAAVPMEHSSLSAILQMAIPQ